MAAAGMSRPLDQQVEEGVDQFGQGFGLLVAVDDDQQGPLGDLPQQDQVERLGGGGESGQGEVARRAPCEA